MEKTGVVARIQETQRNKTCAPQLRIVAVNPVIVLIQPCPHPHFKSSETIAHGTRMAMELWLGSIGDSDLFFDEPMQWLSSDLKVGPTDIEFSPEGVAEVPIRYGMRSGKLKLTRAGEKLQIIRE